MTLNLSPFDSVLFLGEGNFSFSSNLVANLKMAAENKDDICNKKLFADFVMTCFEDEENISEIGLENINYLRDSGCQVLFKVDATTLHEDTRIKAKKISKVIFMFPHIGGKMKIHKNRELLNGIFQSVGEIVEPNSAQLIITLCKGQGGTPFETVSRKHSDTWQILEISQDNNFILANIFKFRSQDFQIYSSVGYRSLQKGFHTEDGVVHVFVKSEEHDFEPLQALLPTSTNNMTASETSLRTKRSLSSPGTDQLISMPVKDSASKLMMTLSDDPSYQVATASLEDPEATSNSHKMTSVSTPAKTEAITSSDGTDKPSSNSVTDATSLMALVTLKPEADVHRLRQPQRYPLQFCHHLSFWCTDLLSLAQVKEVADQCLGDIVTSVDLVGRYEDPSGRHSITVEIAYKSLYLPVGPKKSFHLHYNILGKSLENIYKVVLR